MTDVKQVLAECQRKGIQLKCDGSDLQVAGPKSAITNELLLSLKKLKGDLINLLQTLKVIMSTLKVIMSTFYSKITAV